MYERRELERDQLANLKHAAGDVNRWITRFENHVEVCETVGLKITVFDFFRYQLDPVGSFHHYARLDCPDTP